MVDQCSGLADPGRRRFLRVSMVATVLLASTSLLVRRTGLAEPVTRRGAYVWLEDGDAQIVRRIAPVLLAGSLPQGEYSEIALREIISGFDLAVSRFPPSVRAQIRQLFDLLRNPITRALAAGLWTSWPEARPEQIRHFVRRWQHSRWRLLRGAYGALHDLIAGAWYGNPRAWPRIGYPGPPKL